MCYMESITHREMRNQSAEVLRRVGAGESLIVTNNGNPVAVLSPVGRDVIAELAALGQVRRATRPVSDLAKIPLVKSDITTAEIIADVRGEWL